MPLDNLGAGRRLEGVSVLLAEDNVTNQLVATQMLKSLGAEVEIASDGAIALELLKTGRNFDVLLIDIEMPRVSGLDVIRSVRASDWPVAKAPVIALTAYAMQEHKTKIIDAGADGLIPKPITSIEQFGIDVRSYMDAAAQRPAAHGAAPAGEDCEIDIGIYESLVDTIGAAGMSQLLNELHGDLVTARNQIEAAAEAGDLELLRGASHMLVSVAGAVGAVRLQRQAERLNRMAETNESASATAQLSRDLLRELSGVLDFVVARREEAAA